MVAAARKRKVNKMQEKKKKEEEASSSDSDESSSSNSSEGEKPTKKTATTLLANKKTDKDDDSSSSSSSDSDDNENKQKDAPVFSDKNASWLKPKKQTSTKKKSELLSSSEDEAGDDDDDDDAESEEEEEEEVLDIEREARLADEEMQAEHEDAEEELQRTVREHTSIYHLPTIEETERDTTDRVVPPSELRSHIDSILEVLTEFQQRREPGRARTEYIQQLGSFLSELYGYLPELIEYFVAMLGPAEAVEFIDASDKPRPLVIRTNTLKSRRKDLAAALIKRGVSLDPLASWSKVGLKIVDSPVPIGATPEYLSGMYMLQSAASMCPVLALSPEPKERVLDMSAAPGGKTSYLAQLMRNTGVIFANDIKAERQKATVANMHRLGVKNVIACKHDGRQMGKLFQNRFDRILLDAPCSGLGVISRDPSVKVQRTLADVNQCAHLQKELLLSAIDALKFKNTTGGVMVYSTCSVSIAENEEVVNYALSKRDIRIIDAGLDFGKPGFTRYQQKRFHPSLALTRRFYPHVHNMDGFFVAKIQKISDKRPGETTTPETAAAQEEEEPAENSAATEKKEANQKAKSVTKKAKDPKPTNADKKRKHEEQKQSKSRNLSVPPKKQKQANKEKQSAKTTKPRRKLAAKDI